MASAAPGASGLAWGSGLISIVFVLYFRLDFADGTKVNTRLVGFDRFKRFISWDLKQSLCWCGVEESAPLMSQGIRVGRITSTAGGAFAFGASEAATSRHSDGECRSAMMERTQRSLAKGATAWASTSHLYRF